MLSRNTYMYNCGQPAAAVYFVSIDSLYAILRSASFFIDGDLDVHKDYICFILFTRKLLAYLFFCCEKSSCLPANIIVKYKPSRNCELVENIVEFLEVIKCMSTLLVVLLCSICAIRTSPRDESYVAYLCVWIYLQSGEFPSLSRKRIKSSIIWNSL